MLYSEGNGHFGAQAHGIRRSADIPWNLLSCVRNPGSQTRSPKNRSDRLAFTTRSCFEKPVQLDKEALDGAGFRSQAQIVFDEPQRSSKKDPPAREVTHELQRSRGVSLRNRVSKSEGQIEHRKHEDGWPYMREAYFSLVPFDLVFWIRKPVRGRTLTELVRR